AALDATAYYQLADWAKIGLTYGAERWLFGTGPNEVTVADGPTITLPGRVSGASLASQTVALGVTFDLSDAWQSNAASSKLGQVGGRPAWSGFHVAADVGYSRQQSDWTTLDFPGLLGFVLPNPATARASVAATDPWFGGSIGYDWRFGNSVV